MTVIAWDGDTLAADRRAISGCGYYSVTKIFRVNGCLVGVSGRGDRVREFLEWFGNGADVASFPKRDKDDGTDWTALVVRHGEPRQGKLGEERDLFLERYEGSPIPLLVEDRQHAIGCGAMAARAAMLCGKKAHEACFIACQLDEDCGNGIQTLTFEEG